MNNRAVVEREKYKFLAGKGFLGLQALTGVVAVNRQRDKAPAVQDFA